jgi:ribosomal protein L29
MAETKKTIKKTETKENYDNLSLAEARLELQKLKLRLATEDETNTSKVKKLKKVIARLLTKEKLNK